METPAPQLHDASFRDAGGFVFWSADRLLRQINRRSAADYDTLMQSGLYDTLTGEGLLIAHKEVADPPAQPQTAYKVIEPARVPMISYPYEWCFSMLQDAALLTLEVQSRALRHGMTLKDCSAYNVQFVQGRPVFIDTLSLARREPNGVWEGYRQFCQHFLAPLALGALRDIRLMSMTRDFIDGIPLDLAGRLLPWRTRLHLGWLVHLHAHARAQTRYAARTVSSRRGPSERGLRAVIDNLQGLVRRLKPRLDMTEWRDYYAEGKNNYTAAAMADKAGQVRQLLALAGGAVTCWDFGGNCGRFSQIAAELGMRTVVLDVDPGAVEACYRRVRSGDAPPMLPLVFDLVNPSPAIGWCNRERDDLWDRGRPDVTMALALIHHLALSNNLPLDRIADWLADTSPYLLIEFVPKADSQARILLATRPDLFDDYTEEGFEHAFLRRFELIARRPVNETCRTLYFFKRRAG